jgi:uncharacterized LabA/DUF88 family protein
MKDKLVCDACDAHRCMIGVNLHSSRNIACVDGQNLHLGTQEELWQVDLRKFRIYLRDKYRVEEAYYFLGYVSESNTTLYGEIQRAGFIVVFKEHHTKMVGKKKGNVDADIVFECMRQLIENTSLGKIVLVSGDGDYKKMVDYLIQKNVFAKVLFPNKKYASSLYKKLGSEYYDYLSNVRTHIEKISVTKKGS